jgi:hypothetical protein
VNNSNTSIYWKKSYESIRHYYPENAIMIIDDNSKYEFINPDDESSLTNTFIVKSEYPGRGELLPYIYYHNHNFCDIAVFIHDSVFINSPIELSCRTYKFLWNFTEQCAIRDTNENNIKFLSVFNDDELIDFYNSECWHGCFGAMAIIRHSFLEKIYETYDLLKLTNVINNRSHRHAFERVIACIFQKKEPAECLLGHIWKYCKWGGTLKNIKMYSHLPIIKVWTGR